MTHLAKLTLMAFTALSLTACSSESNVETDHSQMDHAEMDQATMTADEMDHSTMHEGEMMGETGHTTGVIVSVSPDGSEATINHQEIEGVGMGAMTMGFGITSTVDLSGFSKDDTVSFMVKKGRDGSYRITAICNTDTDGKDCLDAKMDHSGH